MPSQSTTVRAVRGLFWVFLGNGLQTIISLITLGALARLVSPREFGLVNAALLIIGLTGLVSQWIGPALIQHKDLSDRHIRTGFTLSLLVGAGLMLLSLSVAPVFARLMRMDNLTAILRAASLIFVVQAAFVVPDSLLARNMRFGMQAVVGIASYVAYGLVGIILALYGWGAWALVAGQVTQTIVYTVFSILVQPFPKSVLLDREAAKDLFHFGGGFTIVRIGNYFANTGDNFVVGRWLGENALGVYSRVFQMIVVPSTMFGAVLDTVLFPAMASVQDSVPRLKAAFRRGVQFVAVIVMPISVLAVMLAPEIVRVILGGNWDSAIAPFRILALSILFRTSYKMSASLARATGAVYQGGWRQIAFAVAVIGGALIGSRWGLIGVAWAVLFANIVNFLFMAQLGLKLLSMSWGDFFGPQLPSYMFGMVLTLAVWIEVAWMRGISLSPVLVVLGAILLMGAMLLLVLIRKPSLLLGDNGLWALDTLETSFGADLPSAFRKLLAIARNAYT